MSSSYFIFFHSVHYILTRYSEDTQRLLPTETNNFDCPGNSQMMGISSKQYYMMKSQVKVILTLALDGKDVKDEN